MDPPPSKVRPIENYATAEALDRLYEERPDPWNTRTLPEKKIRYAQLARLLPDETVDRALDLSCGEGDFTASIPAREIVGGDISPAVVRRAQARYPRVRFQAGDAREFSAKFFRSFSLIVWLDALYWLTREESAAVLEKIREAGAAMGFWKGHDFSTPAEFESHLRPHFPSCAFAPVQLHFHLRRTADLS